MKLEKIVILFLSIICLSNVGANDKENASLNDKVLSSHKNPPTQQNKTSSTFAANDIGPEVALPESNLELNHPQQNILDAEDIGSVKEYFYVLTSISLLVICLIVFRSMR